MAESGPKIECFNDSNPTNLEAFCRLSVARWIWKKCFQAAWNLITLVIRPVSIIIWLHSVNSENGPFLLFQWLNYVYKHSLNMPMVLFRVTLLYYYMVKTLRWHKTKLYLRITIVLSSWSFLNRMLIRWKAESLPTQSWMVYRYNIKDSAFSLINIMSCQINALTGIPLLWKTWI